MSQGDLYLENLFDHLIVHYTFCPRSLETSGNLALSAMEVLKEPSFARVMVNVFTDIVADSFRLERSPEDEGKVLLGWKRLASQEELSEIDRIILGFLAEYWKVSLPKCDRPEVGLLLRAFSPGVRDKSLWPRQCQQLSRVLETLNPGFLGKGPVRSEELLRGNAEAVPLAALANTLEPAKYEKALAILGLHGDLKRWYRDQSYSVQVRQKSSARVGWYPSSPAKWRLTDPLSEMDVPYSLSLSPKLIPGLTTYKRDLESSPMAGLDEKVPDLLVVLDSSRSMEGHHPGTKTHKATLAAFKASQFAHQEGAEVSAVNFSEKYLVQGWTRDLSTVENILVEDLCARTSIPGGVILKLAEERPGCLILCITDTQIQNFYLEWDNIKRASEAARLILFCIDEAHKDKQVDGALRDLGTVYYINHLDDLVSLVVEVTESTYLGSRMDDDNSDLYTSR